jgi:hypothetical protein
LTLFVGETWNVIRRLVPTSVVTDFTVAVIAGPETAGARLTVMPLGAIVPDGKLVPVKLT